MHGKPLVELDYLLAPKLINLEVRAGQGVCVFVCEREKDSGRDR